MMQELEICNMDFKVGFHMNVVVLSRTLKDKWPTIVAKVAQPLGSLHCNFVSDIPFQMTNIVSMQQLP